MKPLVALVAAVLALSWTAARAAEEAAGDRPVKKLLVIGIDGCRFDAVRAAQTPAIDRLIEAGAVAEPIRIFPTHYREADTISGPGWSSILCGVWADKHGVLDNEFTAPKYDECPNFLALIKQARPEATTAIFADWAPIAEKIVPEADVHRNFALDPDKPVASEYTEADAKLTAAAVDVLAHQDPTATFVYLGQVDETGHAKGFHPTVPDYVAAIERVDGHIAALLQAIEGRPTAGREDWLIVLTSDHGGAGTSHGGGHDNPQVACSWLIVSGPSAARGVINEECGLVDAVPTGLAHLGIAIDPAWKLDGRAVGLKAGAEK